jgi:hypothetical protein
MWISICLAQARPVVSFEEGARAASRHSSSANRRATMPAEHFGEDEDSLRRSRCLCRFNNVHAGSMISPVLAQVDAGRRAVLE